MLKACGIPAWMRVGVATVGTLRRLSAEPRGGFGVGWSALLSLLVGIFAKTGCAGCTASCDYALHHGVTSGHAATASRY